MRLFPTSRSVMHVDNLKTGMGGIFPTGELSNAINQGFPAPRKPMVINISPARHRTQGCAELEWTLPSCRVCWVRAPFHSWGRGQGGSWAKAAGDQSKEDTHLWASAGRGRAARSGCLGGPLLGLAVSSYALLPTRDPFVGSQGNRSVFPL